MLYIVLKILCFKLPKAVPIPKYLISVWLHEITIKMPQIWYMHIYSICHERGNACNLFCTGKNVLKWLQLAVAIYMGVWHLAIYC